MHVFPFMSVTSHLNSDREIHNDNKIRLSLHTRFIVLILDNILPREI